MIPQLIAEATERLLQDLVKAGPYLEHENVEIAVRLQVTHLVELAYIEGRASGIKEMVNHATEKP